MQQPFQTPKGTRFLVLVMLALVALDLGADPDPAFAGTIRVAIGLCAIAAVTWFLMAFMRFRR